MSREYVCLNNISSNAALAVIGAEDQLFMEHYGFDLENLYLRVDPTLPLSGLPLAETQLKVVFLNPAGTEVKIAWNNAQISAEFSEKKGSIQPLKKIAAQKIIELAVPFQLLKINPNDPLEFILIVEKNHMPIETCPQNSSIKTHRPSEDFDSNLWSAM